MNNHARRNLGFTSLLHYGWGGDLIFQAVQVWTEGTRQSQAGQSLGKEFSKRREEVAMSSSQSLVVGR